MPDPRPHFFDLNPDELTDLLGQWGMPRFRGKQVMEWVYQKQVADPQQMTNLSKADREMLAANMRFTSGQTLQHQQATDGVQKLLVGWDHLLADGKKRAGLYSAVAATQGEGDPPEPPEAPEATLSLSLNQLANDPTRQTECVMIPTDSRKTACISSQVGCPVGCKFCASGLGGLDSHLTAGQIVEQAWRLGTLPGVGRISNIVFMGMGEPLSNFGPVTRAIEALMADWGMGISGRRITVSTVGLPAQIRRFADRKLPVTLAISLHAPNDALRRQLIPWAEHVTIEQLLDAGRHYFRQTGREVTLEYTLLGGSNDQPQHAQELARIARQLRSNINLIRYNEVDGLPFRRPDDHDVHEFQAILREQGINVHIRASRGRDIDAACGQLRHETHKSA